MKVIHSLIFRGLDMPTVTFLFAAPTRPGHVRPGFFSYTVEQVRAQQNDRMR
jgi:hypothetical protein